MSILDEIFAHKREEVATVRRHVPLHELKAAAANAPPPHDFVAALRRAPYKPALIAEVKRASPSRGLLAPDFDALRLAQTYRESGAACISVLTDTKYFQGALDYLREIAALPERAPLLRKDFICDPYQVYEARAAGADAVLLIAAMLEPGQLRELHALTRALGMAPLVEVHDQAELDIALRCEPVLVGVNNRNLHTFEVSLETSLRLRDAIPPAICMVAESGIHTPGDVARLRAANIDAMLVGEALAAAEDTAAKIHSLTGGEA